MKLYLNYYQAFSDELHHEDAAAILNVEKNCAIQNKFYPILSNILLAKIFYAQKNTDTAVECLIQAIKQPVRNIHVSKIIRNLSYNS